MPELPHPGQPRRALLGRRSDLTAAIIHALNQWMLEHWAQPRQPDYSTPCSTWHRRRSASDSTSWTTVQGTRCIKPAPVKRYKAGAPGAARSIVLADVEEAAYRLCLHASHHRCRNTSTSGPPSPSSAFEMSAFK